MWQMAIPAAINLAGGLLGRSSAKKAANQQAQAREAQAAVYDQWGNQINQGYQDYGNQMFGLADTALEKYKFNPIAARNAFGSVGMQGNELVTQMSPELQQMYGMGANWMNQAGMFDRAGAEGAYMSNLQRLAGTARNDQMEAAMRTLQAKGQMGLGGNTRGNMLMRGLASGWSDQDAQMAKMSMDYGGNELDRMLARGTGMFTNAANLSNNTFNQWQAGQGAANPFQMGGINSYMGLMQKGYGAPLEGMLANAGYATNAAGIRAGAQVNQAAATDAANQGMLRGATSVLSQMPWGSMFGMFGGTGAKNNLFQSAYGPTSMN
jgi:hypothetical protein